MIETFKSKKNGQYYFAIVASNGRTVAQSEGYKTKRSRDRGAQAVGSAACPPIRDVGVK